MYLRIVALLMLCCLLVACGSPEERAAAYAAEAQDRYEAEDYVGAKLEASNALQIDPKHTGARIVLANIAIDNNNIRGAYVHLMIIVESDSTLLEAQLMLGKIYFLGRDAGLTSEQASIVMELAPSDARSHLADSRAKQINGDFDGALEAADAALEIDPDMTDAVLFKASIYADSGDIDTAIEALVAAINNMQVAETQRPREFYVFLLQRSGRTDAAEAELTALTRDFPESEQYIRSLVSLYIRQNRTDDAEKAMEQLAQQDPEDLDRRIMLAQFLAGQRSPEQAEQALRGFIQQFPESTELRLSLGNMLESANQLDEAISAYGELIRLAPTSSEGLQARNRVVSIKVRQGEPDEARRLIDEILRDDPANVDALLARAAFLFVEGNYDAVIADARVVMRNDPKSEQGQLFIARAHTQNGDPELAQAAYRSLLEINPYNSQVATEWATLLVNQGESEQAEDLLQKITEAKQQDVIVSAGLIQTLLAQNDLDAAETEARRLIELNESAAIGHFQLGRVMQARPDLDAAIASYRKALELEPNAIGALKNLTATLIQSGQVERAITALQDYLTAHPENVGAKMLLGNTYAKASQRDAAEQQFEQIIDAFPDNAKAYIALASIYEENSPPRLDALERGIAAVPNSYLLGLALGMEYLQRGRAEDAISTYENALSANSDADLIANNLAATLLDYRTDEASYARAKELTRNFNGTRNPMYADTLGWALYRNREYASAVRYLEIAVAGAGQDPLHRYHLGMAYVAAGDLVGARIELEKALELAGDNDFPGITEARAALDGLEK